MNRHDVPAAQLAPPDFLDRVDLVEAEVQRRKTTTATPKQAATVASLWSRWITTNVLNMPQGQGVAV